MVKIPCFQCGGRVRSLVRELRSHMLCSFENVNKIDECLLRKKEKAQINSIVFKKRHC